MELRNKVGNVAKGTFANMGNVAEREQQMLDAERARNQELMTQAFGSPEAYMELQNSTSTPPMPKTPGQSLGDFFERVRALREPVYYRRDETTRAVPK